MTSRLFEAQGGPSKCLLGVLVIPPLLARCGVAPNDSITPNGVQTITEEAYIFSSPILEQYKMLFAQALYEELGCVRGAAQRPEAQNGTARPR